MQCYRKQCPPNPSLNADCKELPTVQGRCCPQYDCVDKSLGREEPPLDIEETLDMLDEVKDAILDIFRDTTNVFQETNESESDTDSRNGTTNEETILPNTTEQPEIEYSLEEVDPTPIPTLIIATEAGK